MTELVLDLDLAKRVLAEQPFSMLVGATISAFGDGSATIEIPIRPQLLQQHGFVHGGVLAYAADNAITFAGGSMLGAGVLTGNLSIEYVRPARGNLLVARASAVHAGRRKAVVTCEVSSIDEADTSTLCAVAQGTVSVTANAK